MEYIPPVDIGHLRYFYHVVRAGSFTKASETLHVAQPAISKMVRQVEDQAGGALLERTPRGIHLTKLGKSVFEHCEKIFTEVENLKATIHQEHSSCRGPVEIAASEPIASWILPEPIYLFKKDHPLTVPTLYSAPARGMFELIEKGKFDFGLFFHTPESQYSLKNEKIAQMPFELVISAEHANDAKVRSSFIGSREIDDVTTRRFPTVEKMRKRWADVAIQISSNNLTTHKELVRLGAGVAILPRRMVAQELKEKIFKRVMPEEEFSFSLKIVTRSRGSLSRNSLTFLSYVKDWIRKNEKA
jgi:DNA-binding transcriptional LysR family regulator